MSRSIIGHRRFWSVLLTSAAVVALMPGKVQASPQNIDKLKEAAEALQAESRESVGPLARDEIKVLQAVVMSVTGRADWRPDARSQWKRAAVDDLLDPGAEIRTGRRAKMILRIGMNASVLVDRQSRVVLPQMVQVGDTLRTAAQVTRGRADFKVDRVGLTNDFSVVTPSTTLAVRGTGFAVQCGAFNGTEVAASRFNEIFTIEITYFLTRISYALSGGSSSSSKHQNPAIAALFQTFGPPPLVSAVIEDADTPALLESAMSGTPIYNSRRVDISFAGVMEIEQIIEDLPVDMIDPPIMEPPPFIPDLSGFAPLSPAQISETICVNLLSVFLSYDEFMQEDFGGGNADGGFTFEGLNELFVDINEFVCQGREEFFDGDLVLILDQVVAYCSTQFQVQSDFELCIQNFIDAGVEHRPQ